MILNAQKYNFGAKPQVVRPRSKYRQPGQGRKHLPPRKVIKHHNLMFDRRVVRGNTYSSHVITRNKIEKKSATFTGVGVRKKKNMNFSKAYHKAPPTMNPLMNSEKTQTYTTNQTFPDSNDVQSKRVNYVPHQYKRPLVEYEHEPVPFDPRIMENRSDIGYQFPEYKVREILYDKPEMFECQTQTELLLNKPPSNNKIMKNMSVESRTVSTQIVEEDDLFNFDEEVEPILTVLITRCLEQSRMEVLEEEELRILKQQKKQYDQLKMAELAEVQRLEANERRLEEEMARRNNQSELVVHKKVASHQQMCCRVISKRFLKKLRNTSLNSMDEIGYFIEDDTVQMHSSFLPWLFDEVCERLIKTSNYSETINRLAMQVEGNMLELHIQAVDNNMRQIARAEEEEQKRLVLRKEKRKKKREAKLKKREEDRVEALKKQMETLLVRDNKIRTRNMTISECTGVEYELDKEIVGLPGGILMELYLVFDIVQRISQTEGNPQLDYDSKVIKKVIRVLAENWIANEWKFEIGYKAQMEEAIAGKKAELFGEEATIDNFSNFYSLLDKVKDDDPDLEEPEVPDPTKPKEDKLKPANGKPGLKSSSNLLDKTKTVASTDSIFNNDKAFFEPGISEEKPKKKSERMLILSKIFAQHTTFLINELDKSSKKEITKNFLKNASLTEGDEENTQGMEQTEENAVMGSITRENTTQERTKGGVEEGTEEQENQLNLSINLNWNGFDKNIMSKVKLGLIRYIFEEPKEKTTKLFKIQKITREFQDDDNTLPPLCILLPTSEEEKNQMKRQESKPKILKKISSEDRRSSEKRR